MSFYLVVNGKFVVKRDFINRIIEILAAYKVIIQNGGSVEDIHMLISNWSTSGTDIPDFTQSTSVLKKSLTSISKFKHDYTNFITTNCLILVRNLIGLYTIDVGIAKLALENLISVTLVQNDMDSICFLQTCRLRYAKRISNISSFITEELPDIIYRELYFLYLKKDMLLSLPSSDEENLVHLAHNSTVSCHPTDTNRDTTESPSSDTKQTFTPYFLWSNLDNLIFDEHIRSFEDINSLRIVDKSLNAHFTIDKMKSIAIENLMDILQNVFMLNSSEFCTLIANIGAIISGSAIEQSTHGGAINFREKSDLDVYVRDHPNEFVMFITGAGYEAVELNEAVPTIAFNSYFYSNKLMYRFNSSIAGVYNFKNAKGRKIQMILIDDADDLSSYMFGQHIVSMYDFTFLMNFYDGVNIFFHDYQGIVKKQGRISEFVVSKCTYRNETGFQVGSLKSSVRNWYCALTATIIRCLKYEKLGYKIDNIPSLSFVTQLNLNLEDMR
jgi:hypothetical protein